MIDKKSLRRTKMQKAEKKNQVLVLFFIFIKTFM